jgi:hypothetical protein
MTDKKPVSEVWDTAYAVARANLVAQQANHDAVPEAKADLPDERPPNAVSANGGTPGAASRDGSGTGNTPSDAEIDALEFVVVMGRVANGWDKDILRQWLIRLRPEFDSAKAIKEGESDRSQPIGSPAKTNPTQPRNGTPAEGTEQGECSVPDSRSENEPVAWAVTIGPPSKVSVYEAFAAHQKDEAIELADKCRFGDTGMELPLAPLYFAPTLTDAEREAIEWYANFPDGIHADTLRKLLERLTGPISGT